MPVVAVASYDVATCRVLVAFLNINDALGDQKEWG